MYREIIPHTYYQDSHDKGIKPLINAIYLTNKFTSFEKRLLTELALYYPVETRFKLFSYIMLTKENTIVSAGNVFPLSLQDTTEKISV